MVFPFAFLLDMLTVFLTCRNKEIKTYTQLDYNSGGQELSPLNKQSNVSANTPQQWEQRKKLIGLIRQRGDKLIKGRVDHAVTQNKMSSFVLTTR